MTNNSYCYVNWNILGNFTFHLKCSGLLGENLKLARNRFSVILSSMFYLEFEQLHYFLLKDGNKIFPTTG